MTLNLQHLRSVATLAMPLAFEAPDAPVPAYAKADFAKAITPEVVLALLDLVQHRQSAAERGASPYTNPEEFAADLVQAEAQSLVNYANILGMNVTISLKPLQPLAMGNFEAVVDVWRKRGAA